ncbi:MAG TPA: hypothetical protein VNI82_00735 [Candidatus Nitrosotenuis sp.]|nr:hypothetical protein [Candidatus Nitrosotenuis sp.]
MDNDNTFVQSFENGLARMFDYLPQLLGALLLLVVGYIVAKILMSLVRKALQRMRFDRALHTSPAGNVISRLVESPARFVGRIVFWLVFLGFVSLAVSALNLPALNNLIGAIYSYLPHVFAAVVIFLVASTVSGAAVALVQRVMGKTALAKLISTVIPALTMSVAVFMILNELMIAEEIVTITYTALIGAVALGLALAFGLGGREVAARLLEQAYQSGRQNADSAKRDVARAKENTKREASRVADRAEQ